MHQQSHVLTICRTVLKESDDLVLFGVTFDSQDDFREASSLCFLAAAPKYSIIDCFLGDALGVCPACFGVLFCRVVLSYRHTPYVITLETILKTLNRC